MEKKISNLNDGVGDPCAGQVKLAGFSFSLFNVDTSLSDGNFGADPPTGSKWCIWLMRTNAVTIIQQKSFKMLANI